MSILLVEPSCLFDSARGEQRDGGEGASLTLDSLLSRAWEGLVAHAAVACPLCPGEVRPVYGAGAAPVAGSCTDCGTSLR